MQIEFTDRYAGHAPSWLRGCHEDCEATGWVPIDAKDREEPYRTLWLLAEAKEPTDDGYHFVRCPMCHGTGRVSWLRTVLRVPRWLWKGVRFVWSMGVIRNKEYRPSHFTWWQEFVLAFKCAFLADLGLWRS